MFRPHISSRKHDKPPSSADASPNFMFILGSWRSCHFPSTGRGLRKRTSMKPMTKAGFAALAVAGSVLALTAPASAQSVYFGADSAGGVYGGYDAGGYADPY